MSKYLDLLGKTFSKLTVIKISHRRSSSGGRFWICKCECGQEKETSSDRLVRGKTTSCGCLKNNNSQKRKHKPKPRLYRIWQGMKVRCANKNHKDYKYYGEKGISFCDSWSQYVNFEADMKSSYKDHLSLDRIDPLKNYSKENCRWIELKNQNKNKSNTKLIEIYGTKLTLLEAIDKYDINKLGYRQILQRLSLGYSPEQAFELKLYESRRKT